MRIDLLKKWLKQNPYGYCDGFNFATCRANENDCPYSRAGLNCSDGHSAMAYYTELLRYKRMRPRMARHAAIKFAEALPSILRALDLEIASRIEAALKKGEVCERN